MIHYTAWENGRLVRKPLPVIGEYAAGFGFGFTLTLLGALAVLLVM